MDEFLTPKEVSHRLRVEESTVRRWIHTGVLDAETIRQGKRNRHRVKKSLIDAIITTSSTIGTTQHETLLFPQQKSQTIP